MSSILDLPKIELHCHLDGVLDPFIFRQLLNERGTLPLTQVDFNATYPVQNYCDFRRWFDTTRPLRFRGLDVFKTILRIHIERLKMQNVQYTELMLQPIRFSADNGFMLEQIAQLRVYADELEDNMVQVEFLMSLARNRPLEVIEAQVKQAVLLHRAGLICGVALAGQEEDYPVKPLHRQFALLHSLGLGIEIHAGEWCGSDSVWDALRYGFPDRIGHGVAIFDDPALIEHCQRQQTHIEICITSNLKTGSIKRLKDHPVRYAHTYGLNIGINTDDPGVFQCSMQSEYELVINEFDFHLDDLRKLYRNSLSARFQPVLRYLPIDNGSS